MHGKASRKRFGEKEKQLMWAVHNIHTNPIEIDDAGTYSHDGVFRIAAGSPLHIAETKAEAEEWRLEAVRKMERGNG